MWISNGQARIVHKLGLENKPNSAYAALVSKKRMTQSRRTKRTPPPGFEPGAGRVFRAET